MNKDRLGDISRDGEHYAVRLERNLDAAQADVWNAITEPGQLKDWLAPSEFDAREGGRVTIDFASRSGDRGDDSGGVVRGTIRICDPPRTIEYDWEEAGENRSVVRFELEPTEQGTRIVLTHRLLTEDEAPGYSAGWHAHLEALADALAGTRASPEWIDSMMARYRELRPAYVELVHSMAR